MNHACHESPSPYGHWLLFQPTLLAMPVVIGDWHIYQGLFNEFGDLPNRDVQRNEVPMKAEMQRIQTDSTYINMLCAYYVDMCMCIIKSQLCSMYVCIDTVGYLSIYIYANCDVSIALIYR